MRGLTALLAMVLVVIGCAPAAPATPPAGGPGASGAAGQAQHSPEVQRLLAAARDAGETDLDLSWSEDTIGGVEGARRLGELFNRMYGLNVKVSFTPGNLDTISGKIAQEVAAGRTPYIDVFLGSETHFGPLLNSGVFEEYDYTLLSPRIPREIVEARNIAVEVATRVPGITYNTNLVPAAEAPRRLEDALQPKWKGRIATTQTAIGFDRLVFRPEWNLEKMRSYVGRLSEQAGGIIRGGEQERIASGEFLMMVINTGSMEVRKLQSRGAPVAQVIPEDGALLVFHSLGIPRGAARPNLAKLFINTVLSEEGQRLVYEMAHYDQHLLPGSKSAAEVAELTTKGVSPLKVDVAFYIDHPETAQIREEMVKLIVEKRGS
jgi:iron(III) transport system substrate-binding protein